MSYHQQHQGQGWGQQQPPYGQQYGGYAPPYGQQPPPPQGYPSPQGGYGYPPPPQGHSPFPPQQAPYSAPPPQQPPYGAPPPQGGFPAHPPPPGQYGAPPPTPPSLGYDPRVVPMTDMNAPAIALRDAMKGFGTNEAKLISTLAQVPDAPHMIKLRHTYDDRFRRDLLKDIKSETSGYFEMGLLALCRGPLLQDAWQVNYAVDRAGTKERLLDDVVLGRSNADLQAIMACYREKYKKDMREAVRSDLSLKTKTLFEFVLEARRTEESAPVLPAEVEQNVDRLQQATEGTKFGTNQEAVCQIMAYSSNGMIRAINLRYKAKYRQTLDQLFSKNFSGHMEEALRLMAARAVDPIKADADKLEDAMKGMGTKDEQLVTRLVRAHWDKNHFNQVKAAYREFYKRDLASRVSGETSGDYKRLLVAICQS